LPKTHGFPLLIPKPNGQTYLHNQRLGKVTSEQLDNFPKYFFYHVFLDNSYRAFVVGSASGTSVKHTSPNKILSYEHLMPSDISNPLIKQFDEFAKDIYNQINTIIALNEDLTKARDLLLPKLMSGEIAV
jgi:type I restriction enzyme S subunit